MNIFKFRPVGQGLFYTGKINDFTFVYDCGALSSLSHASRLITVKEEPSLFREISKLSHEVPNKIIDFLVISHLDADHVNGVIELSNKMKIKKVFLPYFPFLLTRSMIFDAYLYLNNFSEDIIMFIKEAYSQVGESFDNDDISFNQSEFSRTRFYSVKNTLAKQTIDWNFVFFQNDFNLTETDLLKLELDLSYLLSKYNYKDVVSAIGNNLFVNELKILYKNIFKIINQTSIILLHYPNGKQIPLRIIECMEYHQHSFFYKSCTLLTGDLNFNKTGDLITRINNEILLSNLPLGHSQLPHHGSNKNFPAYISAFNYSFTKLVMCYGVKNPWPSSFPSIHTIKMISKLANQLEFVTEYKGYSYTLI